MTEERTLFSGKLSNHPAAKEKGDKKMKPKLIFAMSILPLLSFAKEFPAVEIVQKEYGFMDAEKFLAFLQGNLESSMFAGMSIAAVLLAAFAGGIALNLTPCVLPVIPVNLSIIGASDPQNRKTGILRACVYALGMILACGGVGLAAVLGGASLGGIASTWYFNLIAALIFVLLGLSMFGVLNVDLTKYQANLKIPSSAKLIGIFLLGGITALLAGACVAPVVIAIMIYSAGLYASGAMWGLILPFLLGIGMALPWPLLAAGISFLPKPGGWMVYVKYVFGLLIVLLGIYYGITAWNLYFPPAENTAGIRSEAELAAVIQHAKETGKPVLVDFYADWCKNCVAMKHSTLEDPKVKEELEHYIFVVFDATKVDDPEVQKVLSRFDIKGLPAFLILKPQ